MSTLSSTICARELSIPWNMIKYKAIVVARFTILLLIGFEQKKKKTHNYFENETLFIYNTYLCLIKFDVNDDALARCCNNLLPRSEITDRSKRVTNNFFE